MRILLRRRHNPDQPTAVGLSRSRGRAPCAFALLFVCLFLVSVAEAKLCVATPPGTTPETWAVLVLDDGGTVAERDTDAIAHLFENDLNALDCWRVDERVFRVSNVGNDEMVEALERFAPLSVDADLALVFYAGNADVVVHVQADGRLPALPDRVAPLPFDRILPAIAGAKRQIVILDTDVPHVIAEQVAGNQFVAYAGAPGGTVVDSLAGETNSPFTRALLEHLDTPGRSVREVFDRVGATVRERTGRVSDAVQSPFFTSGWEEPYVLVRDLLSSAVTEAASLRVAAPEGVTPVEAKLDGALLEMVRGGRDGRNAGGLSAGDRVAVEIVCESPDDVAAVRERVAAAGGAVTASFEEHLWAEVPLTAVEGLAATPAVWTMALNHAVARPVR